MSKKVLVLGGAGRVGSVLASEMARQGYQVVSVDNLDAELMQQKVSRNNIDNQVVAGERATAITAIPEFDLLDRAAVAKLIKTEQPDLVVNYAIPFTWDATKALPNYQKISKAGLGAFAPIQVLVPFIVAQAIREAGVEAKMMVGNLPDITVPIMFGLSKHFEMVLPSCGSGNVGLMQSAIRYFVAKRRQVPLGLVDVRLVAHHLHWVAPREPGYSNEGPFKLKVSVQGEDISHELGDLRALLNNAIVDGYEAGAGFSSTTGLLAAQTAQALVANDGVHKLHVPAPLGLPGGYPVQIENGEISLDLPEGWNQSELMEMMNAAHRSDGIQDITADGRVIFTDLATSILENELGFSLPKEVMPEQMLDVAYQQLKAAKKAISTI